MVYTFNTFFMDSLHKLYWVQNSEKQHISYISSKIIILDIMAIYNWYRMLVTDLRY